MLLRLKPSSEFVFMYFGFKYPSSCFLEVRSHGGDYIGADGLVGYDTALTRQGSRVQFPLRVVVFVARYC